MYIEEQTHTHTHKISTAVLDEIESSTNQNNPARDDKLSIDSGLMMFYLSRFLGTLLVGTQTRKNFISIYFF